MFFPSGGNARTEKCVHYGKNLFGKTGMRKRMVYLRIDTLKDYSDAEFEISIFLDSKPSLSSQTGDTCVML